MGRFAFALTSFTAALPAALLSAVLVMAFTSQLEGIRQSFLLLLMVGMTLGLSSFVVLIPFGILVFGGPKKAKSLVDKTAKKADKKNAGKDQPDAEPAAIMADSGTGLAIEDSEDDILAATGSAKVVGSDDAMEIVDSDSSGEFDIEEMEETSAFSAPLSSPDADVVLDDDFAELGEIEEIEDEVVLEDDDEDTKPKKKRR